jgi:hypothetical protein
MTTDGPDTREPDRTPTDVPLEDTMTTPTTSGPPTAPLPTATPAPPAAAVPATRPNRVVRVGTIVWGLVIAAIGALILASALDVDFDTELAVIIVMATAGVLLLGGTIANSLRRKG